ncbi:hypothetical protein H6758_03420 [Candidatus Nomurabacteria bacterium]|nr:hypothetical protein [Candidatus Nomurabacteria bacterium]
MRGTTKDWSHEIVNTQDRKAVRSLSETGRELLGILESYEKIGFVNVAGLCAALDLPKITLVTFSCLASIRGKQELQLDLLKTFFFRSRKFAAGQKLLADLNAITPTRLIVILPDLEPKRTWGWDIEEDELTCACELMIDDAREKLPDGFDVVCWSHLETDPREYQRALLWALEPTQRILVHQEAEHLREYPDILFPDGVDVSARKQVAAYAHEGRQLEKLHPHAILVQSEFPPERKDKMYQPLRNRPLPIIHPFE